MVTAKQEADPLFTLLMRAAAALKAAGDAVAPRVVTIDERPTTPSPPTDPERCEERPTDDTEKRP
jgi:hypothetical protein